MIKKFKDYNSKLEHNFAELKPVMFSIYGHYEGPWYFGYRALHKNGAECVIGSEHIDDDNPYVYAVYPKLVIDFKDFDPYDLKNNK